MSKKFKIIWAVDAFDIQTSMNPSVVDAVCRLTELFQAETEPVYVLSDAASGIALEVGLESTEAWLKHYRSAAQAAMEKAFAGAHALREPRVLVHPGSSKRLSVNMIRDWARTSGADLILMSTHARKGAERLVFGSFSELLVSRSEVDVLVLGPGRSLKADRILVPVDFGPESFDLVRAATDLSLRMRNVKSGDSKAEMILYHVSTRGSIAPVYGDGLVPILPSVPSIDDRHLKNFLDEWATHVRNSGVEALARVEPGPFQEVSSSIAAFAQREKASLIVLCAERGPVASLLLGSIVRKVLRLAPCPVWVIPSSKLIKKTKTAA